MIQLKTLEKIRVALDFLKNSIANSQFENRVYLAGGAPRDLIMGVTPKDIDVVVVGDAYAGIDFTTYLAKKIGNFKPDSNPVIFPTYFTAKLSLRGVIYNDMDLSDVEIEAVAPRKEKYTPGNRNPSVEIATLEEDSFRRDLCLNSLFLNISNGEILDYTGKGISDIKNKILRTPINPYKTFEDDGLRLLRIVRFYARYGWKIPLYVIRAMRKSSYIIKTISSERIQDELNKILVSPYVYNALRLLKITKLLDYIIPEFKSAYKMTQNIHHKHDVFTHTLEVLKKTKPVLVQRLMALFHDIGKTTTRTVINNDVHFYDHENVSADMARAIMSRLKYPNEVIDAVVIGVQNHMRLKSSGKHGDKMSDKSIRKFIVDLGDHLEYTLDLMHSDNLAHSPESRMPDQIPNIIKRIEILKNTTPKKNEKLPITGEDLIKLGLRPGPLFSKLLDLVKDKQLENPTTSKEEYLELIKNYLQNV